MQQWLNSIQDLLEEYKKTRNKISYKYIALREDAETGDSEAIATRLDYSKMLSDLDYIIEWLETGRRPGNRRGIERRAAYQREKLMDPIRMQAFISRATAGSPANLTEWQRQQIEDALCMLTDLEKEAYTMAHGQGISHSEIAEMLNISKGNVSTLIKRAQEKITTRMNNSLFLVG